MKRTTLSSIPALKDSNGAWHLGGREKAQLLQHSFEQRYMLEPEELNEFSNISPVVMNISGPLISTHSGGNSYTSQA